MRAKVAIAAVVGLTMCGATGARAQMSGVSHPDEVIEIAPDPAPAAPPPAAKPSAYGAPVVHAYEAPAAPVPVAYAAAPSAPVAPRPMGMGPAANTPDIDANVVTEVDGPHNRLPEGTLLKMRLHQTLSTLETKPGANFDGELFEPVVWDGKVLLPVGTLVAGRVTEVRGGHRISGAASIHLLPTSLTLPDGTHYTLRAQVIDTDMYKLVKVDREGTISRRDHPKETLAVLGGVTGSGAVAGAVFGGAPGALIGAGIGAGVSTAWWLKQDRQTALPADTKIIFSLTNSLTIGAE